MTIYAVDVWFKDQANYANLYKECVTGIDVVENDAEVWLATDEWVVSFSKRDVQWMEKHLTLNERQVDSGPFW